MVQRPLFIVLAALLCLPTFAASQGDSGPPADILAVRNISSMELARVKGHWLVKRIKVGKVDKL